MSYHSINIIPDGRDLSRVHRSYVPPDDTAPALYVAEGVALQFNTAADPEFAVGYLTKLASEATALAETIAAVTS